MPLLIPGTTHGLGTANLLAQIYDAAIPATVVSPGSLSVDTSTYDVTIGFLQPQTGTLILTSAIPQFVQTFTTQTTVTIPGATHGLGTAALLYQVYDNSSPRQMLDAGLVTVHPGTFDVIVIFSQAQTGRIILWAPPTAYVASFTAQTTLTIPQSTHGLSTAAVLVQAYDALTPAQAITPGRITVHPTTYEIGVTFLQAQSGTLVVAAAAPSYVTRLGGTPTDNFTLSFAGLTFLHVSGNQHQMGHDGLLVALYDDAIPAILLPSPDIAIDRTSFGVRASFSSAQSGTVVINGYAGTLLSGPNQTFAFTNTSTYGVGAAAHGLATRNLLVAVYSASAVAQRLSAMSVRIDPVSFGVTVTLSAVQDGYLVVNGFTR